jgi:hypothetical protein
MTFVARICWTAFLFASLGVDGAIAQTTTGTVSLPSPGGQPVVVPGVTLTLTCPRTEPRIHVSGEIGEFRFAAVPVGDCD